MKLEDVLQLGAMGFTKDDIMKLVNSEGGETVGTKPTEPDKTEPEKKEEPDKKEEKTPENKEYEALKAEMEEMKKLIQKQAIQDSTQPEAKTVDDMLSDLLKGL